MSNYYSIVILFGWLLSVIYYFGELLQVRMAKVKQS